jgi:hypothetical protein
LVFAWRRKAGEGEAGVKVLFVGEGPHELGPSEGSADPQPATGTVPILARKICPAISADSVAIPWRNIPLLPLNTKALDKDMKKRGYEAKAKRAVLLSIKRYSCGGTVCVVDEDTAPADCLTEMKAGCDFAKKLLGQNHVVACGLAIKSIEAWTLGVPKAIAEDLGLDLEAVKKVYPHKHVEELSENSGKAEYKPKALLQRIAQLKHESDSTKFRMAVAERTSIAELRAACPKGFDPFVKDLQAAFG